MPNQYTPVQVRATLTCPRCGGAFTVPIRKALTARFCSKACRFGLVSPEDRAAVFSVDGACATLPLFSQAGVLLATTIVDAADATWAQQWTWRLDSCGYASRSERIDGEKTLIRLHRELLGLPRASDGRVIDHIDRDRLNNRRQNLRTLAHAENPQNRPANQDSGSHHRGVSWNRQARKWTAYVGHTYLGRYASEEEAAAVAREARARLMPYAVD